MKWFSLFAAFVSTGGCITLFAIREIHPLGRASLTVVAVLSAIIAIPATLDALSETANKLDQWGLNSMVRKYVEAQQVQIEIRERELKAATETKRRDDAIRADIAERDRKVRELILEEENKTKINWTIKNDTRLRIWLEFSANPQGYWPGKEHAYVLAPGNSYDFSLKCVHAGQSVCFGAWVSGNPSRSWGVGHKKAQGCTDCCHSRDGQSYSLSLIND